MGQKITLNIILLKGIFRAVKMQSDIVHNLYDWSIKHYLPEKLMNQ